MPNINYANINIGIQQFQDISTGEINAGEGRLRNEHSLDMINNHAHKRGSNKTSLSHREVLAIKNAFVRSLSESGVGAEEINRVRQELGLAPRQPVDRSLLDRSIKPLSRQHIREILDHNADTINANVGPGTIRTSEELQARVAPRVRENRRARREEINAELPARRALEENRRVAIFQSVVAGDVDFHDDATRRLPALRRGHGRLGARSDGGTPGRPPASLDNNVLAVKAFDEMRTKLKEQIDQADIPPAAKDAFKSTVLALEKVKDVNVDVMVAAAKSVSGRHLLDLLDANAPAQA